MTVNKCKKCKRLINGICCHPGRDLSKKGKIVPLKSWLKFKIIFPHYQNYCAVWAIQAYNKWLINQQTAVWNGSYDFGKIPNPHSEPDLAPWERKDWNYFDAEQIMWKDKSPF